MRETVPVISSYFSNVNDACHNPGEGKTRKNYFRLLSPNKESLVILVPSGIKDAVLSAIYKSTGMGTAGQGIAFSVAVNKTVGLQ